MEETHPPCPWCQKRTAVEELYGHMVRCSERPAAQWASAWGLSLGSVVGVDALVRERQAWRRALSDLTWATQAYLDSMGWDGERGYTEAWSEQPWRRATAYAARVLGVPDVHPGQCPPRGSPVRAALERLRASPRTGSEEQRRDIRLVEEAARELDDWQTRRGRTASCPACGRRGIEWAALIPHLERCPQHPAVRRARDQAAWARLSDAGPVDPLQLEESFSPEPADRSISYERQARAQALAQLLAGRPPIDAGCWAHTLNRLADDWEVLQQWGACAWCQAPDPTDQHLLECARHPSAATVPVQNESGVQASVARVWQEADLCAVTLARLRETCDTFWNRMDEGERGKSLSRPEYEALLDEALREARRVLASVPELVRPGGLGSGD